MRYYIIEQHHHTRPLFTNEKTTVHIVQGEDWQKAKRRRQVTLQQVGVSANFEDATQQARDLYGAVLTEDENGQPFTDSQLPGELAQWHPVVVPSELQEMLAAL